MTTPAAGIALNVASGSLRRGPEVLYPDPSRTITKLFLPGQEMLIDGVSRADAVIARVTTMTEADVSTALASTRARFPDRSDDFAAAYAEHFDVVARRSPGLTHLSAARQSLIGAYFTQQYAVEGAALFNPSLVAHPDQHDMAAGYTRFILSLRAVGEGHVSSIEFRTGVLGPNGEIRIDEPGRHLVTGRTERASMSRAFLRAALAELGDIEPAREILGLLPEIFTPAELQIALSINAQERLTRSSGDAIRERVWWIASCNYRLVFPADHSISERVIHPNGPDESHGIEDARFTRFRADDGEITYYATCTAFDGSNVTPHLLQTKDFATFDSARVVGRAAKNKGMALFPRLVGGQYMSLSRWDRESIGVASSADSLQWGSATTLTAPVESWELIQLGNCGPPIETDDGWLVFTHGVGPMREYQIGAMLLDLDDPTKVIASSKRPLLTATGDERDGYVPDVVYSCGGMVHGSTVVLPYGCSDARVKFATADLSELIEEVREGASSV